MRQKDNGTVSGAWRQPSGTDQVLDSLLRNYPAVQYEIVKYLSEHLADSTRSIDGDLDQVLILAVLGQRFLDGRLGKGDGIISSTRLADVTGLPRETVRRKLVRMSTRNWVAQEDKGGWTLKLNDLGQTYAGLDLADVDRRGMERLARLYSALMMIANSGSEQREAGEEVPHPTFTAARGGAGGQKA